MILHVPGHVLGPFRVGFGRQPAAQLVDGGHRIELACPDPAEDAMLAKLDAVKWDMLEEWSKTKRAPKHAAWMHENALKDA